MQAARNNWLAALQGNDEGVSVALLDISTGELRVATLPNVSAAIAELVHAAPRELLVGRGTSEGQSDEVVIRLSTALGIETVREDAAIEGAELAAALGDLAEDAKVLSGDERLVFNHDGYGILAA